MIGLLGKYLGEWVKVDLDELKLGLIELGVRKRVK